MRNSTAVLLLSTVHYNISAADTVSIDSHEAEVTMVITSRKEIQMTLIAIDPSCTINATNVTGCYSCTEAAKTTVYCYSEKPRELALDCSHQTFLLKCSTKSEANHLKLEYNHAHVQDRCRYQCGAQTHDILLAEKLLYHRSMTDDEIFDSASKKVNGSLWEGFSIPDMNPLMMAFVQHWKISLSVIATFAIVVLLIYAFGPSVIVALIKVITAIVELLLRTLFACLGDALKACLQRAVNDSTKQ
ncbi:hypothetical protein RB195_024676 [Necator americanus]|uniref:Phlebovirus glycoprotein G2 C-terminal domain-containing protein n=1 Tax=Necator americanus TaxID=51031 RepID=A0ABR1EPA9_NECAM